MKNQIESRGAPEAWAYDCALAIVNGAYSLHGRPIIGNSNEVEARQLAEMILRFHQPCASGHVVLLEALRHLRDRVRVVVEWPDHEDLMVEFAQELVEAEAAIQQAERT